MNSTNEINKYLKRLKDGEPCLNEFFNEISGHIRYIAYRYLINSSFVDDVVNDTFSKIFDNIQKFDELQNGKAWIFKIAQNEAYSINKRESKHSHASLDEISEEVIACTVDEPSGLEFVIDLDKALSKLDETDRQIVEWRILEDLTFEEIAHRLSMHVGTVHKRFKRSVKKINEDIL